MIKILNYVIFVCICIINLLWMKKTGWKCNAINPDEFLNMDITKNVADRSWAQMVNLGLLCEVIVKSLWLNDCS